VGLSVDDNPDELFIFDVDGRGFWLVRAALKSTIIGFASLVMSYSKESGFQSNALATSSIVAT
jgi:hypothetical protein